MENLAPGMLKSFLKWKGMFRKGKIVSFPKI